MQVRNKDNIWQISIFGIFVFLTCLFKDNINKNSVHNVGMLKKAL